MQPMDFPYWDNTRTQPNGQSASAQIASSNIPQQPLQPLPDFSQQQVQVPQGQTTAIARAKPVTITIDTDAASIGITITPH